MQRLGLLVLIALFCVGCAAGQWDEALKDLRGDNMKMRSDRDNGERP